MAMDARPKGKKKERFCNRDLASKEAEPKTILLRQGDSEEWSAQPHKST